MIVPTMKSLIMRSMLATRKLIDPARRRSCFELFGYDFIIDEDFNTWLIEVNTNPCIEESSSILKAFLPRMIDEMLKLRFDTFYADFTPKKQPQEQPVFKVPGYTDTEPMWELLCNLRDKKSKKEAKARFITQHPLALKSKYAFQVKDREFKIKKYIVPTAATSKTTAGVSEDSPSSNSVDSQPTLPSSAAE